MSKCSFYLSETIFGLFSDCCAVTNVATEIYNSIVLYDSAHAGSNFKALYH